MCTYVRCLLDTSLLSQHAVRAYTTPDSAVS